MPTKGNSFFDSGAFYALLTNLCFAFNFAFLKVTFEDGVIDSLVVNFFRSSTAVVFFTTFVLLNRKYIVKVKKEDWIIFIICGLLGTSINQILFMRGMSETSAIHASMIALFTPLMVIVFERLIFRKTEGMKRMQWVGILLSIAGATLLTLTQDEGGHTSWQGDLKVLLNFIFYALFLVLSKPLTSRYHPLFILMIMFLVGYPIILVFSIPKMLATSWYDVSYPSMLGIAGSVIFATILSHFFNIKTIKRMSPSLLAAFIYLQPIIASTLGTVFFGEVWSMENTISFCLVGMGLYLVSIRRYKKTQAIL